MNIDEKYIEKVAKELDLDNNFLKKKENNIMLRDNEIDILLRNNIEYQKYSSLSQIIYEIEQCLNSGYDDEELENLSRELSERNYYENTNK